ncbi:MAG: efflux RND transporter permease subunit, partial [Candidatus Hydrogenedentes bacterium]|nr:efflux RND transporter permease subunit [Candidatus Hydrogenedentota bacterium]
MTEPVHTPGEAERRPPESYRLALRRPVTMSMVFLTMIVFGWKSYQELPINLMPDISYPTLSVRTEYEGAAPEDVEKLVTRPLEERLSIVNGVVELSSVSSAGLSEIVMEFRWGTDMNVAMQDVRESLDIFDPPEGVTQKPVILRYDPTLDPVMRVAILGRDAGAFTGAVAEDRLQADLTEIREAAEKQIKSDLEAQAGIAEVRVKGGREEEIQIMLDSARLKNLGLTPADVVTALQQQNVNLSGGRLKEGRTEYLVRTLNEFQDIEEIRGVIIGSGQGVSFRLDDVARIELGTK